MKIYATHIVIGLALLGLAFVFFGCEEDTAGPSDPEVNYLPQKFSLAISNGATDNLKQGNHGYSHNGNTSITLDWNGETGGTDALPVTYVYDKYPLIDGGATTDSVPGAGDGDADVWANAEWTTFALSPQYGDGGVTSVRMKAVYTYVNPPRIWFLLNWSDPIDYPDAEVPYNSGMYGNCWLNTGADDSRGGFEHNHEDPTLNGIAWDHHEDWVSFMWDTWDKVGGDTDFVFESQTNGFQTNGCAVTCHNSDPSLPPHSTNGATEYVDMWVWSGTRSNYTSTDTEWLSRTNDPSPLFDCYLDSDGMDWGPIDQKMYYDDDPDGAYEGGDTIMWYQNDSEIYGYLLNGRYSSGTEKYPSNMSENDPGANQAYFWNSEFTFDFSATFIDDEWEVADKIGGYLNRQALGSCADVGSRGSYDAVTGEWTLELGRNIGSYDKIINSEDCLIGIYEAHPGQ